MGLDGISINQLRVTPERTSAELNNVAAINLSENRVVDELSIGQRVDPDKEHEKDTPSDKNKKNSKNDNKNDEENEYIIEEPITKYDLSDTNKFNIKLDSETNKIIITEKSTGLIIQTIDADELLKFVEYSPNSCGSIINKKL